MESSHDNSALMHAVLQLSPFATIFHSRTPATVHASRVDVAILPIKPLSPEAISGVKEPYLPGAQLVQVLAPAPACLPAGQMGQTDAPAAEYVPAAHSKHADALDAPSVARYVPAAQSWQAVAPDCAGRRMRIWLLQSSTW